MVTVDNAVIADSFQSTDTLKVDGKSTLKDVEVSGKIISEEFADPNTNFYLKLTGKSVLNSINANMVTVDNAVMADSFQAGEGNNPFKIYLEGANAALGYIERGGTDHFGGVSQGMTFTAGGSSNGFLWVSRSGGSSFEDIMALTREGDLTVKKSLTVDGVDILDALSLRRTRLLENEEEDAQSTLRIQVEALS